MSSTRLPLMKAVTSLSQVIHSDALLSGLPSFGRWIATRNPTVWFSLPVPTQSQWATGSAAGSTIGVRFDISMYAAIKAEARVRRRADDRPRANGGFLQIAFTF